MTNTHWYDGWSITTDYIRDGWTRKTIRIPNSHTCKIKMVMVPPNSLIQRVLLDLDHALFTLTQRDKEYER